ncbi:MAG: DNA-directed RNA polymerase subunit omega [Clostridia bacterium]|nr:DNA-directed RNA polymerase subunit omega [Clostridia bacterium]
MLNPNLDSILEGKARYSLVIATAKRAREISDEALEKGKIITEKPVTLALDEFIKGERVIQQEK